MSYRKTFTVVLAVVMTAVLMNLIPVSVLAADYNGTIRVYVVEPESRWVNHDGYPFHFGFLDFAVLDNITIPDSQVWDTSLVWTAATSGFTGVTEDNVMVIAALFNASGHDEDFYPPYGYWFTAYNVDAAAAAEPGQSGRNLTTGGFTHTVFAEEGTANWCPNCPTSATVIYDVYSNDNYPFYFVSLVDDMNYYSAQRLNQYWDQSQIPLPIAMFDGGYRFRVGADGDLIGDYRDAIEDCGARSVPPLDLMISLDWLGDGAVDIDVSIGNGVSVNDAPSVPSAPTGNVIFTPESVQSFHANTTDPNDDALYYQFDWGDGEQSEWLGPYSSGSSCNCLYSWSSEGMFDVRVRAKDAPGETTDWSPLLSVNTQCCISTLGDLDGLNGVDGVDLSIMIDRLFVSLEPWICLVTADCDQSGAPSPGQFDVDGVDLSYMINTLFITLEPLPDCP